MGAREVKAADVAKAASEAAQVLTPAVVMEELHKFEVESLDKLPEDQRGAFIDRLQELVEEEG